MCSISCRIIDSKMGEFINDLLMTIWLKKVNGATSSSKRQSSAPFQSIFSDRFMIRRMVNHPPKSLIAEKSSPIIQIICRAETHHVNEPTFWIVSCAGMLAPSIGVATWYSIVIWGREVVPISSLNGEYMRDTSGMSRLTRIAPR